MMLERKAGIHNQSDFLPQFDAEMSGGYPQWYSREYGEFSLEENQPLHKMLEKLRAQEINWGGEYADFIQSGICRKGAYNQQLLSGILLEQYLHHFFISESKQNLWGNTIQVNAVPPGNHDGYYFAHGLTPGRSLTALRGKGGNKRTIAQYDLIARVGGLITIIEAKVTGNRQKITEAMFSSEIVKHAVPLQAAFPSDSSFGYVIVGPSDVINPETYPSQQKFVSRGGLLTPLSITYRDFIIKTNEIWERLGEEGLQPTGQMQGWREGHSSQ